MAARHRAFIAPRLLGSFALLAMLPFYLALRGVPSALEIAVFAWLIVPIAIGYFLSRTGRYDAAHVLSTLSFSVFIAAVAWKTGGIASPAVMWLVIVPLEAALSASRRVLALAAGFSLAAAGFLLWAGEAGLVPNPADAPQAAVFALNVILGLLCASALALGSQSVARRSSRLLQDEEDRYRLLAQNMTDVISRHGRHGAVLFISPAAERLFGVSSTDLLGHGLFDRVHVSDRPAYLTALADAASGERSVEFRVRRDADETTSFVWIEMRCRPLQEPGAAGRPERDVVAVMRDITERKAQERALEEAHADAEQASAAKTRFLATMSHELRTPLNAIIGFSEMLTKDGLARINAERRQDYARLINDSGQHLLDVVNGILDMSKMEAGDFEIQPEAFAPGEVIAHCCDLLAMRAREAGLDLQIRLSGNLPDIAADKRALKQILLNLLSNAIKFTETGGSVAVTARADAARLIISVEDSGIGISQTDLERVGDAFFQAHSSYNRKHDGTGLGLCIVKELVALHGGEFEMRSALGKGTRVTIRLPFECARIARGNKGEPVRIGSAPEIHSDPQIVVKKIA